MSRLGAVALSIDLDDERYDWRDYGTCRTRPDINFFPERGENTRPAKVLCATCPVRDVCREVALANGERYGIWGGLSERERRRIRRQRGLEGAPARTVSPVADVIVAHIERCGGRWVGTTEELANVTALTRSQVTAALRSDINGRCHITSQKLGGRFKTYTLTTEQDPTL